MPGSNIHDADDLESFLHTLEFPQTRWGMAGKPSPFQTGAERIENEYENVSFGAMVDRIPPIKTFAILAGVPLNEMLNQKSTVMTSPALEVLQFIRTIMLEKFQEAFRQRQKQVIPLAEVKLISDEVQAVKQQQKSKNPGTMEIADPIEIALLQSPRLLARYRHLKSLSYPAMLESTADVDGLWNKPPEERDDSYLRRGWKELQNAINKIEGASAEVSLPGLTVQLVRHDNQHG